MRNIILLDLNDPAHKKDFDELYLSNPWFNAKNSKRRVVSFLSYVDKHDGQTDLKIPIYLKYLLSECEKVSLLDIEYNLTDKSKLILTHIKDKEDLTFHIELSKALRSKVTNLCDWLNNTDICNGIWIKICSKNADIDNYISFMVDLDIIDTLEHWIHDKTNGLIYMRLTDIGASIYRNKDTSNRYGIDKIDNSGPAIGDYNRDQFTYYNNYDFSQNVYGDNNNLKGGGGNENNNK